jgi:ABC-type glycerol-3-phosphate transport system substrate-binding protein
MGNIAFYAREAKFKFAMTHLPEGPVRRATLGTTDGWGIYKSTPQPDASWELMKVLVGDDLQNLMIDTWGGVPNRKSLVPSWKDKTIASFPVLEEANLDAVLDALDEGYPTLTEEFKNQAESQQLIDAALQKIYQVGDTPVSYFEEVAAQVTTLNREA